MNYNKLKEFLSTYGIVFEDFLPLFGKFIIPASLTSYNKEFTSNITDEKREHAFLIVAKSCFEACNQIAYMRPLMYKQSNFEQFKHMVGKTNAELFRSAVLAEIDVRCVANTFPELANAASAQFSQVNYTPMTLSLLLAVDQISIKARTYLDQSTWNLIPPLKSNGLDEPYAFVSLSNTYSGILGIENKGFYGWDEFGNVFYYSGYVTKIENIETLANSNTLDIQIINQNLANEIASRQEEDTNLQNQIDDLPTNAIVDKKIYDAVLPAIKIRGNVPTYNDLLQITNPEIYDAWMVLDENRFYIWNGSEWIQTGGGFVLPTAREDLLGGLKSSNENYKINIDQTTSTGIVNNLENIIVNLQSQIDNMKIQKYVYDGLGGTGIGYDTNNPTTFCQTVIGWFNAGFNVLIDYCGLSQGGSHLQKGNVFVSNIDANNYIIVNGVGLENASNESGNSNTIRFSDNDLRPNSTNTQLLISNFRGMDSNPSRDNNCPVYRMVAYRSGKR